MSSKTKSDRVLLSTRHLWKKSLIEKRILIGKEEPDHQKTTEYVKANTLLCLSPTTKTHIANLLLVPSFLFPPCPPPLKKWEFKRTERQNVLTRVPVGVAWPESLFPDDIILSQASNVDDFFSMSCKLSFSRRNLIECPASKPSFFSSCSIMLSNWRISAICKKIGNVLLPKMTTDVCTTWKWWM